jgi:hypothetical protein
LEQKRAALLTASAAEQQLQFGHRMTIDVAHYPPAMLARGPMA